MRIFLLMLFIVGVSSASPSVDLGSEIYVPLEKTSGFSLINKETGHVQIVNVNKNDQISFGEPIQSNLTGVTGASSGIMGEDAEKLILASPESNRLALVTVNEPNAKEPVKIVFSLEQGPQFPVNVKPIQVPDPWDPEEILVASKYDNGGESITYYRNPQEEEITGLDKVSRLGEIGCLQPLVNSENDKRLAVGVESIGLDSRLFVISYIGNSGIKYNKSHLVPDQTKIATNVKRQDEKPIIVGYVVGQKTLSIILADNAPELESPETLELDFSIGSVVAIKTQDGPDGILVNAADGSLAVHYQILTSNKLKPVNTFVPDEGTSMNGIVPVPGKGIMMLTGEPGTPSSGLNYFKWEENAWKKIKRFDLPALSNPSPDYATLFWFSSKPLVNADSILLNFQSIADWTVTGPIETKIYSETYLGSEQGLGSPQIFTPQSPDEASYFLTNQYMDSVSLSALDSALILGLPQVSVSPKSGQFDDPILVNATSEESAVIYYREDGTGSSWKVYSGPILVSYPKVLQFYAEGLSSRSPIVRREYNFDFNKVKSFDSDGDTVPDFVEESLGLNPSAGADSDADGFTDLDEILNDSAPDDDSSRPAQSSGPFSGQSFRIAVSPRNYSLAPASVDVFVDLRGMRSELLDKSKVQKLYEPPLVDQRAAIMEPVQAVPINEWVILNSPNFFDSTGPDDEGVPIQLSRTGREIYRVMQRPVRDTASIDINLEGISAGIDAGAWISAAKVAHAEYQTLNSIQTLDPVHSMVSVLLETAVYNFLDDMDDQIKEEIGVPLDIPANGDTPFQFGRDQFTLFGSRTEDTTREPLNNAMITTLEEIGLSFDSLLKIIEEQVIGDQEIKSFCNKLYQFHVEHSAPTASPANLIPLIPLPIDAIRLLLHTNVLHPDYESAFLPGLVQEIRSRLVQILEEDLGPAIRPMETWIIEAISDDPENTSLQYRKVSTDSVVFLFTKNGKKFSFDRGLGLLPGTRYVVTGYTDVDGPDEIEAMEILRADLSFTPVSSDNDQDSDLLDDEWEQFFFGETNSVSAYDRHPSNDYTYLQLYLLGYDPRDDVTTVPDEAPLIIAPMSSGIQKEESGDFVIEFNFPEIYFDSFDFTVLESDDLAQPVPMTNVNIIRVEDNRFRIVLGPNQIEGRRKFYQVSISLTGN
jgi:hypothetical protein